MRKLAASDRKYLRSQAHHLDPIVLVGKNGVTDTLIESVDKALEAHELIKVKFNDLKDQKKELSAEIESRTRSSIAGLIGNVLILYRQQRDEEKRKVFFPDEK